MASVGTAAKPASSAVPRTFFCISMGECPSRICDIAPKGYAAAHSAGVTESDSGRKNLIYRSDCCEVTTAAVSKLSGTCGAKSCRCAYLQYSVRPELVDHPDAHHVDLAARVIALPLETSA